MKVLVLAIWLAVACGGKPDDVTVGPGAIAVTYENMPDDSWRTAGKQAVAGWRESLAGLGVDHATVKPFAAPNGATVPFLLEVDAPPKFHGIALVYNGVLINKIGASGTARYLASLDFPAKPLNGGLLLEILAVTEGVTDLPRPSKDGWDALKGITLSYLRGTAVLVTRTRSVTFEPDGTFAPN
jgi:hypothetical protein